MPVQINLGGQNFFLKFINGVVMALSQPIPVYTTTLSTYHFFDNNRGGELRGIRNRARIGCISHNAEKLNTKERHSKIALTKQ